jgi:hypothetical protein
MRSSDKTVVKGWAYFFLGWLSLCLFGLLMEVMNGGRKFSVALGTTAVLFAAGVALGGIIAAIIIILNRIRAKS